MMGLLYRAVRYFMKPSALNKGELDQPLPAYIRRRHLEIQLEQARREEALEAERVARIKETRYSPPDDETPKNE